MWRDVQLCEQIRPWATLACCWDVKQPPSNTTTVIHCSSFTQNSHSTSLTRVLTSLAVLVYSLYVHDDSTDYHLEATAGWYLGGCCKLSRGPGRCTVNWKRPPSPLPPPPPPLLRHIHHLCPSGAANHPNHDDDVGLHGTPSGEWGRAATATTTTIITDITSTTTNITTSSPPLPSPTRPYQRR